MYLFAQVLHPSSLGTKPKQSGLTCLAIRYLQSISPWGRWVGTPTGTSEVLSLAIKHCSYTLAWTNGHRGHAGFAAAATASQILLAKEI